MYVYKPTGPAGDIDMLYTVGFYSPDGAWQPESDHTDSEEAAKRVAWLNGSGEFMEHFEGFEPLLRDLAHSDTIKNILADERAHNEAMADAADARSY